MRGSLPAAPLVPREKAATYMTTQTAGPKPATNGNRIAEFIQARRRNLDDDVIALLQGEASTAQAERAAKHVSEMAGVKVAVRDLAIARAKPDLPAILNLADVAVEESQPLLIDRYHPTNHTIVYGPGGVGKGTLLSNDLIKLGRAGVNSVILDYERHPEEWKPRIYSLGGADFMADGTIGYWSPPAGPIWDHVSDLHAMLDARNARLVVVDSVTFACAGADTVGDPNTAIEYQSAVSSLQMPTISLAHVTKENKNPEYPFGTVFWHNAARLTYSFEFKAEQRLLKPRKTNNYQKRPAMLVETIFEDRHDGLLVPINVYEKPYQRALIDLALEHLDREMTTTALLDKINEALDEEDKAHSVGSLQKALKRDAESRAPRIAKAGIQGKDAVWRPVRDEA